MVEVGDLDIPGGGAGGRARGLTSQEGQVVELGDSDIPGGGVGGRARGP